MGFQAFWDPARGKTVKSYIGAIDQGTTSTRFMVFDKAARMFAVAQKEHH
jgi:glycerol kinase